MPPRRPTISQTRKPQQARSTELVAAILEAAVQVLAREGIKRFTMARVAERTGASIGSLYQYFPNKAAILFRLQSDEWRQTTDMLRTVLQDQGRSPSERLRALVRAFIRSECEEAEVRVALASVAPLYRDAPEGQEARAAGDQIIEAFMMEALPGVSDATREAATDLIMTTMATLGKEFSESPRMSAEIDAYADAMADMFCAYLEALQRKRG
ncbi:TetR family transcriptional regulator [Mesorhizobium sp. 1M-11]|uniref:TetR family transcriptional regulator n=1 Tax=Mesorhizobium sp. 1M-11 TaxID=1529006 RepID=UPI0006C75806|nr:TetR family transcriptional regulator [Mesorhizobium sp. 1M-11]